MTSGDNNWIYQNLDQIFEWVELYKGSGIYVSRWFSYIKKKQLFSNVGFDLF